jgi:hypothetical protein
VVVVGADVAHDDGAGHGLVVDGVPHPQVAAQGRVVVADAAALLLALGVGQGVAQAVEADVGGGRNERDVVEVVGVVGALRWEGDA